MKKILVGCLILAGVGISFSQTKYNTREEKLQQLKTREDIKVTEVGKNLLKLEYPNGKVIYKNIADYKPTTANNIIYSPTYDSTIIDLINIDTTLYYQKYKFWQEVPLTNFDFSHILVGDVNNNGKTELYGARKFFETETEPVSIYELNNQDEFVFKYQYDSIGLSWNIYDVNKDGRDDFHALGYSGDQRFFSKEDDTSFAKTLNISFFPFEEQTQLNDQKLGDFDNDGNADLIFARFSTPSVYIYEFNSVINNFDSVYRFDVNGTPPWGNSGFSIDNFDSDGKTDIVFGTVEGDVFVMENQGDNQYNNSWQGTVDIYNAYIHTWTHDIDNNGKPEFWVLGDGFINGSATTRITIFENNGDDSYQVVGKVDLLGVFSFYAGTMQAVDIDNDGVDEVAICIDDNFLILKFNGSRDHQTYEVYYIKKNDLYTDEIGSNYYGAIMYDLLNDNSEEILISMNHILYQQNIFRMITRIYKPDSTTNISEIKQIPVPNELKQNYPSPFNPSTRINFTIGSSISTSIKVFNTLGKEIKTLLEKNLPAGEHSVQWNGKDDEGNLLPGGVYFIQMIAGSYQKTIKTVLLK